MHRILTIALIFISYIHTNAQNTVTTRADSTYQHHKGDQILNIGIGFINASDFALSGLGGSTGTGSPSPSLNLSFDYGLTDAISIGAFANYYRVNAVSTYDLSNLNDIFDQINNDPSCALQCLTGINLGANCQCTTDVENRVNVVSLGGKLALRRSFTPEIDTYASTYLGYSWNKQKTITESALDGLLDLAGSSVTVPKIIYFGVVGARYFITPQWAIYGEFGYSNVHLLQVGASHRFN